jgi:hypothetical protein
MSPTELKMQPTIYLERKAEDGRSKYPTLRSKYTVGCIFNCVGFIITHHRMNYCKTFCYLELTFAVYEC